MDGRGKVMPEGSGGHACAMGGTWGAGTDGHGYKGEGGKKIDAGRWPEVAHSSSSSRG